MTNEVAAYYFPDYIKDDEEGNATFVAEEVEYVIYYNDDVYNRHTFGIAETMVLLAALNHHGCTGYTVGYSGRVITSIHYKTYDEETLRIVSEAILNPPEQLEWNGRNLEDISPFGFMYSTEKYPYQDISLRIVTKQGVLEATGQVTDEAEYDEVWNEAIDKLYQHLANIDNLAEYILYHKAVIRGASKDVVSEKETKHTLTPALYKYLMNGLKVVVPVKL